MVLDDRSAQGPGEANLVSPFFPLEKRPRRRTIEQEITQERSFIARAFSKVASFFVLRDQLIAKNAREVEAIRNLTDPTLLVNGDVRWRQIAVEDSGSLVTGSPFDVLNFGTNLSVSVVNNTATIDASAGTVDIQDGGSPQGAADTINFDTNLSVVFAAGTATISASGLVSVGLLTLHSSPVDSTYVLAPASEVLDSFVIPAATLATLGDRVEIEAVFQILAASTALKTFIFAVSGGPTLATFSISTTSASVRWVRLYATVSFTAAATARVTAYLEHDYLVDAPNEGEPRQIEYIVNDVAVTWSGANTIDVAVIEVIGFAPGNIVMKNYKADFIPV